MDKQKLIQEIQQCDNETREKILYMAEAICRYRDDEMREERILLALKECMVASEDTA